ncbi:hypothetical protein KIN20_025655 [Parelaphostrongylus tenuis]|uniref:Uncharacterized protein n=1 Tax=Parelaphostrongylus tenuis TaxID=148309 RepID=A0AAD5MVL3_PARTN|nr:hypothetical protein KIN20_025655 [Parelaphostrongylus tenuis]
MVRKARGQRVKRPKYYQKQAEAARLQDRSCSLYGQENEGRTAFNSSPNDSSDSWFSFVEVALYALQDIGRATPQSPSSKSIFLEKPTEVRSSRNYGSQWCSGLCDGLGRHVHRWKDVDSPRHWSPSPKTSKSALLAISSKFHVE